MFGLLSLCVVGVDSAGELIALRAALGVAAAAMAPITNSLVFRLFDDEEALRMRAITVMIVVGMSGFVLGPLLGGTALAHVRWEWLLVVNAPIALIACIGVRLGVSADRREDLTEDALDLPGAGLEHDTIGLAGSRSPAASTTAGSLRSRSSRSSVPSQQASRSSGTSAVSASPMLDLGLFSSGTDHRRDDCPSRDGDRDGQCDVRTDPAFPVHLRLRSPVRAGTANLPMIVTMLAATPLSEWLGRSSTATESPASSGPCS